MAEKMPISSAVLAAVLLASPMVWAGGRRVVSTLQVCQGLGSGLSRVRNVLKLASFLLPVTPSHTFLEDASRLWVNSLIILRRCCML